MGENLYVDDRIQAHRASACSTCAEICILSTHTHHSYLVYGNRECVAVPCNNVPTSSSPSKSRSPDLNPVFSGSMRLNKRPKTATIGYVRVVFRALVYEQLICMYDISLLHACMQSMHRWRVWTTGATGVRKILCVRALRRQVLPKTSFISSELSLHAKGRWNDGVGKRFTIRSVVRHAFNCFSGIFSMCWHILIDRIH